MSSCFSCISLPLDSQTTRAVFFEITDRLRQIRSGRSEYIKDIAVDALQHIPESESTKLEVVEAIHFRYALENDLSYSLPRYLSLFYKRQSTEKEAILKRSLAAMEALYSTNCKAFIVKNNSQVVFQSNNGIGLIPLLVQLAQLFEIGIKSCTNLKETLDVGALRPLLRNCFTVLAGTENFHANSHPAEKLFSLFQENLHRMTGIALRSTTGSSYSIEWTIDPMSKTCKCRLITFLEVSSTSTSIQPGEMAEYVSSFFLRNL